MRRRQRGRVEDRLIELFQALGIAQAHIAAGQLVPSDWLGLAAGYPERVASLILLSPRPRSRIKRAGVAPAGRRKATRV